MRRRRPFSFPLLSVLAAVSACATTVKDFRLDDLQPDEAAVAGRVNVIYNGRAHTEFCEVDIAGTRYQLDRSGMVFLRVKPGPAGLAGVFCEDSSLYHYQFEQANFVARGGGAVTYFGNATIHWKTDGGFKYSVWFGLIGAAMDASSNDGHATISVLDDPVPVQTAFARQAGRPLPWIVDLMTTGS
jgi:hypothetical protein